MHILIIPPGRYMPKESPLYGIFQHDQAHALRRAGVQVGVIAYEPRSLRFLKRGLTGWTTGIEFRQDEGIPVYCYQGWSWVAGRTPYLAPWFRLRLGKSLFERYVAAHGMPDLVHAHNAIYAGAVASAIKREFNIPYVLTEHSSAYASGAIRRWQIPVAATAFMNANRRIVVSVRLGELLEAQFGKYVCPWDWIPNVLDRRFEQLVAANGRGMCTRGAFRFLNIAGLIKIKNQAVLLEAFASRFKGQDDVQLRIGGHGPLRRELESLAGRLGIASQVVFLGLLKRDQVDAEIQACDAFVLASDYETFGVALIEALARGKPVIATSGSGPDCIVHSDNGILVPPGNATRLAEAMEVMLRKIASYDSGVIQRDCIARFGENAVVEKLTNVYCQALS